MAGLSSVFLKTLAFTLLVPGTVTVVVPYLLMGRGAKGEIGGWSLVGVVPMVFGAACYLRCAFDFTWVGRGTPAPIDPPKKLVASGLYRFVRNPMYIGAASIVLGEAIVFTSERLLVYALILVLMFNLFVLLYEEPTLRRKFGAAYEEYCKAVPRWLPRIRLRKRTS